MEAILAFGAALVALRLAGLLASRWRERREPYLAAWAAGLAAYALGAAAIAWGAAAGWNEGVFRAYYLFGGLLTAARTPAPSRSSTRGLRSDSRSRFRSRHPLAERRSRRRRST